MKTTITRRISSKKYKENNYRNQLCIDCKQPTEAQFSRCKVHRRWLLVRNAANRHFMRDFK